MSSIPLNPFLVGNALPNSLENILQMSKQPLEYYLPKENSLSHQSQSPLNFGLNPFAQLALLNQKQGALLNSGVQRPLLNLLNAQMNPSSHASALLNLLSLNALTNGHLHKHDDSKSTLLSSSSEGGFHMKNKSTAGNAILRPITVLAKPEPEPSVRTDEASKESTSEPEKESPKMDIKSKKIVKKQDTKQLNDKLRNQPKRAPVEVKVDDSNRFEIILGRMDEVISIVGYDNIDKKKLYVIYERSDKNVKKFFIKLKRNLYYYRKTLRTDSSDN